VKGFNFSIPVFLEGFPRTLAFGMLKLPGEFLEKWIRDCGGGVSPVDSSIDIFLFFFLDSSSTHTLSVRGVDEAAVPTFF
jgi:hypothetical protein